MTLGFKSPSSLSCDSLTQITHLHHFGGEEPVGEGPPPVEAEPDRDHQLEVAVRELQEHGKHSHKVPRLLRRVEGCQGV